jgi:phospholipid/cholesterol/gamma-HCH transport system substrate-binding protein
VLQGEGGTVENLLAHTASLTTALADKDQVIGELIGNLNGVLDTVNARTPQLNDLVITLQQLVSGLAQDRKPIGDAVEALGGLATTTSGLLEQARAPLKQDIANLGVLTDRLNAHEAEVEHFIQFLPVKTATLTRTVSYGSWFNFFLCSASGAVVIPGLITQPINIPIAKANLARCT